LVQINNAGGFHSYGPRLRKYLSTKLWRQIGWRQQINVNAQQRFQLNLQPAQVKQSGAWQGIDQQIEIAAFLVSAQKHRAENTRVRRAEAACRFVYGVSVEIKHE
jgi:hypothetical protein